jgi:DNA-directed RNA polymerase specialized sigma24 family protein
LDVLRLNQVINIMGSARDITRIDVREQMAHAILDFLAHLPEAHKQAFVWRHYGGYGVDQIARKLLNCRPAEVEGILDQIDSTLLKRASTLRPYDLS